MMLRASIVMDYQNVHMTAKDTFEPFGDLHDSLIHPKLFAQAVIRERNLRQREGYPLAELSSGHVFRGLPHVDHDGEKHRRCQGQASEWRAAGAIVELRDLKYRYKRAADGHPVVDLHGRKEQEGTGRARKGEGDRRPVRDRVHA